MFNDQFAKWFQSVRVATLVLCVLAAVANDSSLHAAPFFTGLGPGSQRVQAISGDGRVAVGDAFHSAYRWTLEEGLVEIGADTAFAASHDGSVIVGGFTHGDREAYRWTQDDGIVGLGGPGGARAVSADGSVVAGFSGSNAFRWTSGGGMTSLGIGSPWGISTDGSIIVGSSSDSDCSNAVRWTAQEGMVSLGELPGGRCAGLARDLSSDGGVIVGNSYSEGDVSEAFRWTSESGMVGLGRLTSDNESSAYGVSADGSVIVGGSTPYPSPGPSRAFIWDATQGMQDLQELLSEEYGLGSMVAGWSLWMARGISDDGRTIVGWGTNSDGLEEGWLVRLADGTPGDTNADGAVDLEDLNNVRNNFGGAGLGDTNADGIVDLIDLNSVRNHFGETAPSGAVPEPSGLVLGVIAVCFCVGCRIRPRRFDA
jgi:probable HAF family extracellular repeat protein